MPTKWETATDLHVRHIASRHRIQLRAAYHGAPEKKDVKATTF
jgi:hypothetical protein